MATNLLAPIGRQRAVTDLGVVAPGALLYTLVSGSPATPQTTTSDAAGTILNANPIVASAGGLFGPIYVTPNLPYHFRLTDAAGFLIWDQDPVTVNDGASNPGDAFIAGNLTVGGALTVTGFGPHIISGNAPGFLSMQVRNTYPTGGSQFVLGNDLNFARTIVQSQGSGFASNGALIADGSLLAASGNGGLSVQAAGAGAGAAIRFYTAGNTQRLTILSTGEVLIAAAANVGPGTLCVQADTPHLGLTVSDQSAAQNQTLVGCFNSAGTFSGGIQHSGPTSVVYTTSSDARLKTDDGRASDLAALRAVVVHDFTWKADGVRDRGIFAQEAAALYPRAVTVGTDETTAAGSLARPWQTDYSKFVADLIVGWQQHDAELADLRARLAPQGAA